jgi:hypothetical protein
VTSSVSTTSSHIITACGTLCPLMFVLFPDPYLAQSLLVFFPFLGHSPVRKPKVVSVYPAVPVPTSSLNDSPLFHPS